MRLVQYLIKFKCVTRDVRLKWRVVTKIICVILTIIGLKLPISTFISSYLDFYKIYSAYLTV